MAADSRSSDDGRHTTTCQKIFRLKSGALLGTCGDDDARDIINLLDNVIDESKIPPRETLANLKIDGGYLLILPNKQIWYISIGVREYSSSDEWYGEAYRIMEPFAAIGSGSHLAIGALEFGASASEAVSCACKWDLYSSPPVTQQELTPFQEKTKTKKK